MGLYWLKHIRIALGAVLLFGFGTLDVSGQSGIGTRARNPLGGSSNAYNTTGYGATGEYITNEYGQTGYYDEDGEWVNADDTSRDSTQKPPKVRKPLESYFFGDSLRARPNFVWTPSLKYNQVNMADLDTLMDNLRNQNPSFRKGVGAVNTGNLGGPSMPLDYNERADYRNFSFAGVLDDYIVTPERARFFNVKKPFSQFGYFFAGQPRRLEENFSITHAQNVSPSTGFNVDYKSRGMRGIYQNHKSRDKNLSVAFSHTGKKYTVQAGYIYNMARLNENGGIIRDFDVRDTIWEMPELVDVHLKDAKNLLKNNTVYLIQSYGVPLRRLTDSDFSIADRPAVFIGHSMEYSTFKRTYTDTYSGSTFNNYLETPRTDDPAKFDREYYTANYYNDWYISPASSRDSVREMLFSNKVFVQLQPWDRNGVVGVLNAGLGNDMHRYDQFYLDEYMGGSDKGESYNSTYVYGSVEGKVKKYAVWNAFLEYHPFGYRSQDMLFGGDIALNLFIKDKPLTLSGRVSVENRSPDYWAQHYFSNHHVWSNSFLKETETRFAVRLTVPQIAMELGASHSMTTDKVYYGYDQMPAQWSGVVNATSLYAQKDFRLGGLHLNNRVLLQFTNTPEVVQVPLLGAYLSYYYEFNVVKNVLRMQIGFDGRYTTKYDGYGYNPATMQFYVYQLHESDRQIGGYPMVDLFVAAKWKRMRILVQMAHLNDGLFGGRNYFAVQHHPLNKRVLKLGLSWAFYD